MEQRETDEALAQRFQSGDDTAFKALLDRYSAHLINFAYRYLGSKEEAEDIAQEIFLRIYRRKDSYDPARLFRPWLFAIAARLISNRARDRGRRSTVSLDQETDDGSTERPGLGIADAASPVPEGRLAQDEAVGKVRAALEALPEDQRRAVLLAKFEDMPYEEIAQAMATTVPAVKSLLFRARQSLKTALAGYAVTEERRTHEA